MNYNKNSLKYRYIKLWVFFLVLFSCIMILLQIFKNNTNQNLSHNKFFDYKYITANTPLYPPPLFNFMN